MKKFESLRYLKNNVNYQKYIQYFGYNMKMRQYAKNTLQSNSHLTNL